MRRGNITQASAGRGAQRERRTGSESPAAPELPRSAGLGGWGVTKVGALDQGRPLPSGPPPRAPTWGRQHREASEQQQQRQRDPVRGRSALHEAGGGGLAGGGADKDAGRGSLAGARRGDSASPRTGRASAAKAGPRGAVQLSRPGRGRGEGAAEEGPRGAGSPLLPGCLPALDIWGHSLPSPARRRGSGPQLGVGAKTPNFSLVGPKKGGVHSPDALPPLLTPHPYASETRSPPHRPARGTR